ncbi:MAG: nucleotidyltransferase family protein [Chloroflexi bacterium]|nr:nucleotidyltransferase family protein [Chloroflexota bacterium]
MRLDEVLRLLKAHREEIVDFGVTSLSVFGSVARDEAGPNSDVDILVEFGVRIGLFQFVRLKNYLEKLLGRPVDLAMVGSLREEMREQILGEAVRAA